MSSGFDAAVELRLGEKRARQFQDLVGPAQFLHFALKRLDALTLFGGNSVTQTGIDLMPTHPFMQGLGYAADLRRDRFNGRPFRRIFVTMLLHHAHGAFADFGGKTIRFVHGSILSRLRASSKPGAIQVAENDKPIVGVYLPTLETRSFKSGSDAARQLGMKNTDMPMGVARGDRSSVADWWFRFADDLDSKPPEAWGDGLRVAQVRRVQAKSVIALNLITKEERQFPSTGEAGRVLGIEQSQVVQILKGDGYSAKDWWFRYEGDDRSAPEIYGVAAIRAARDKKIFAVHLKTGERREFRNCTVADNELNIYKGAAAMVASGERTSAADWWFTYDPKQEPPTVFKGALVAIARSKAVIATDIATGHKCFFQNAKAASEKLGISRSMISMVIKGKRTSAKGYVFRFA